MRLVQLSQAVLATEPIDPAARINDFLLARVKRVARRTHFDQKVLAQGRAGREFVAATTSHFDVVVIGMNVGFHWRSPVSRAAMSGRVGYREAELAASRKPRQ